MEKKTELVVHGRGNAWPVPLGEEHPFYDRHNYRDLSNAAFSLVISTGGEVEADVLVDAGHGTIQSLLSGSNRIPDCICLTHGHMDHTLSVDWVVQSYWKRYNKERCYPVYGSAPVCRSLVQSYPQLREMVECVELTPGITMEAEHARPFRVTAFPVYHGQSAAGASMILLEGAGSRVLFTGDILTPLLREEDYDRISGLDLLVVDTNNRFPWPRTNHWSLAGHPRQPIERSEALTAFLRGLTWEELFGPHLVEGGDPQTRGYLDQVRKGGNPEGQPFTILEFIRRITPGKMMLVHYSGGEDRKYYNEAQLDAVALQRWSSSTLLEAGMHTAVVVPETGAPIAL